MMASVNESSFGGDRFGEAPRDTDYGSMFDGKSEGAWRRSNLKWSDEEYEQLRDDIARRKPLRDESHTYKVLLVGAVRAGKSSVINTFYTALRNELGQIALNAEDDVSITKKFRVYRLRKSVQERAIRVTLCDTMGFEQTEALSGPTIRDIEYILDGHIKDGYEFDPNESISYNNPYFNKDPGPMDKVHAVVFVVESGSAGTMNADVVTKLKEVAQKANAREIRWAVLMTKIDCACPDVERNLTETFQSSQIKECVESINDTFGLIKSNIFPIQNYGSQGEVDLKVNILALDNLRNILRLADNTLECQNQELPADMPEPDPLMQVAFRDEADFNEQAVESLWGDLVNMEIESVPALRIALFGPKGAGKSAFINSCWSDMYQRIVTFADTGDKESPTTTHYEEYTLKTGRDAAPLPVKLIDTMGFMPDAGGLMKDDVSTVLDGKVQNKTPFNPSVSLPSDGPKMSLEDRVHTFLLVLNGKEFEHYPNELMVKLKEAMNVAKDQHRAIPILVLLTHMDEACYHVQQDASTMYRSPEVERIIALVNKRLQIPHVNILPVVNFHNDTSIDWKKSASILKALLHMVATAEDFIDNSEEDVKPQKKKGWFW